jgi:hypothetical protein
MTNPAKINAQVTIQAFKAKAGDFLWLFENFYEKPRKVLLLQDVDTNEDLECPVLIDSSKKIVQALNLFQTEESVTSFTTAVGNIHNKFHNAVIETIQLSKNKTTNLDVNSFVDSLNEQLKNI